VAPSRKTLSAAEILKAISSHRDSPYTSGFTHFFSRTSDESLRGREKTNHSWPIEIKSVRLSEPINPSVKGVCSQLTAPLETEGRKMFLLGEFYPELSRLLFV